MPSLMTLWDAGDEFSESVQFGTALRNAGVPLVWLLAGDEEGPAYLTPDAARKAAEEWPALLRQLADDAEREAGVRP